MRICPLVTAVPLAKVIIPKVGNPVTVMVRVVLSASVGAVNPNAVSTLSSSTFIVLFEATGGQLFTVTISVSVNCIEHVVEVLVAKTLNVVVVFNAPVERLIVPPVPKTAAPIFVAPSRN